LLQTANVPLGRGIYSVGDVNSDGAMDIISAPYPDTSARYISVFYGNTARTFANHTTIATTHCPSTAVSAADLDGNGINDLIIPESACGTGANGTIYIDVRTRNSNASYNAEQTIYTAPPTSGSAYAVPFPPMVGESDSFVGTVRFASGESTRLPPWAGSSHRSRQEEARVIVEQLCGRSDVLPGFHRPSCVDTELLHHGHQIPVDPLFDDHRPVKFVDRGTAYGRLPVGRRHPQEVAPMSPIGRPVDDNFIALRDGVIDVEAEIGKCLAAVLDVVADVLRSRSEAGKDRIVEAAVAGE
jgi:hypothetical protein